MTITDLWIESLQHAWSYAKGARMAELRGKYVSKFDTQGVHPLSEMIGRIRAYEALEPDLSAALFNPVVLRSEASEAAESEYRNEILAGAGS